MGWTGGGRPGNRASRRALPTRFPFGSAGRHLRRHGRLNERRVGCSWWTRRVERTTHNPFNGKSGTIVMIRPYCGPTESFPTPVLARPCGRSGGRAVVTGGFPRSSTHGERTTGCRRRATVEASTAGNVEQMLTRSERRVRPGSRILGTRGEQSQARALVMWILATIGLRQWDWWTGGGGPGDGPSVASESVTSGLAGVATDGHSPVPARRSDVGASAARVSATHEQHPVAPPS